MIYNVYSVNGDVNTKAKTVILVLRNNPNLTEKVYYHRENSNDDFIASFKTNGRCIDPADIKRYHIGKEVRLEEVERLAKETLKERGYGSVTIF